MPASLLTHDIWKEITQAIKSSKGKSHVAVAYFGDGGSKLLPLNAGSKLVVDASEHIVKSGQTDPDELIKLYKKGVRIYSFPNLHAKTYATSERAFIGSSNVSSNSANQLQEAVISLSEKKLVKEVRKFVEGLCKYELGEESLKQLLSIYKPPKFIGVKTKRISKLPKKSKDHQIRIVNLVSLEKYPEGHEEALEAGEQEAKQRRIVKSRHRIDEFYWYGDAPFKKGEHLITVLKDVKSKIVSPPSIVIHKKVWNRGKGKKSTFVYVETLDKRSRNINQIKKHLNKDEKKAIEKGGYKSPELSSKLIALWS